jgi:predicted methyltransferase
MFRYHYRGCAQMSCRFAACLIAIELGLAGCVMKDAPKAVPAYIASAIAAKDRPQADVDRDTSRKPAQLLAFAEVRPNSQIADIMPGGGYFTRLFSHAVGTRGHVYAVVPSELAQVQPKAADDAKALAADPSYGNVSVSITPTTSLSLSTPVDIAWTSDNYHDLYIFFGAEQAQLFDKAVFRMLRPGGLYIIIDHVANAGTSAAALKKLHRIDPAVVKEQALAAGFQFEGSSDALSNANDTHNDPVFDPAIRGHTDQFVYKFRKPKG